MIISYSASKINHRLLKGKALLLYQYHIPTYLFLFNYLILTEPRV